MPVGVVGVEYQAGYLRFTKEEFEGRIAAAKEHLHQCLLCPRECGVDRTKSKGFCGAGDGLKISSVGPHFGEERQLVGRRGSGTIFFAHCNLRCVYCQNYQLSFGGKGSVYTSEQLAAMMLMHQEHYGCSNINLVTPTHLNLLRVDAIILAAWTFYDIRKRRDHFGWVIGVLIAGVLVLPVYLAKRSLKPRETREGGTGWNVLKTLL